MESPGVLKRWKVLWLRGVLDQHKCCREREKLEFLVTQKFRKKKRGMECRRPVVAAGGATAAAGKPDPARRRVGLDFSFSIYFFYFFIFYFNFFILFFFFILWLVFMLFLFL